MSERTKHDVEVEHDIFWPLVMILVVFWAAGGFERLDCALGVEKACADIAALYEIKNEE